MVGVIDDIGRLPPTEVASSLPRAVRRTFLPPSGRLA
jgi:hypothetical protein